MVVAPIQTSFAGGEISPRLRGRVDAELYQKALAFCENWKVSPQGGLLMRAGSEHVYSEDAAPRLLNFRVSGSVDDYVISIGPGRLRIFSVATRSLLSVVPGSGGGGSVIVNGGFESSLAGWTLSAGPTPVWVAGEWANVPLAASLGQDVDLAAGTWRVRFKARRSSAVETTVRANWGGASHDFVISDAWVYYEHDFVPTPGVQTVYFYSVFLGAFDIDDVTLFRVDAGAPPLATELVAPWTAEQLEALQYDAESVKNRIVIVHPNVAPHVLSFVPPNVWTLQPATFINKPVEWDGANWPGAIEIGFQGRMWLGATPNEPHTFWGSRSGRAFDFTTGSNADDRVSWIVSTKGAIRWMRGQRVLLAGSEVAEHAIAGGGSVISGANPPDVSDQSAYGSAPVQALHLGDEVVFAGRDRRSIRALSFDAQTKDGWVAPALSFVAEHLMGAGVGIKEIAFARSPDETLFVLTRFPGTPDYFSLIACTYDRSAGVLAWWRIKVGQGGTGAPLSMTVADGANGSELWLSVNRAGYTSGGFDEFGAPLPPVATSTADIEVIPLHEVGAVYLDSAKVTTAWVDLFAFQNNQVPPSTAAGAQFSLVSASAAWTAGRVGVEILWENGGRVRVVSVQGPTLATVQVVEDLDPTTIAGLQTGTLEMSAHRLALPVPQLAGQLTAVVVDGAYIGTQTVDASGVAILPPWQAAYRSEPIPVVIGRPFTAKATTLPRVAKTEKARDLRIGVLLNDSALPLLNGQRVAPDRTPSTPQDTPEPRRSGRFWRSNLGWQDDGVVTIEQDIPIRTEVLAVFADTKINAPGRE